MISAESDLRWFFTESSAALGHQSSFGAMRMAIMSGGASSTSKPDNMSDARLNAATRWKHIDALLRSMPAKYRDLIYAAYNARRWNDLLVGKFGVHVVREDSTSVWDTRRLGVMPFTKSANEFFEQDAGSQMVDDQGFYGWLTGCAERMENERCETMVNEADALLQRAIKRYSK